METDFVKRPLKSFEPFEWMVKYTPQEVWIVGKGLYLWLAFLFTEICAGAYFIALFLEFGVGMLVGWLGALGLGGLFHLLYLGKAMRGWRIPIKVLTSELSRGLWIIILFGAVGFFQVLPVVISNLPWTANNLVLNVLMGIICILLIIHGFTTMSVVRALPMWNSPMMIPLSLASGIWVGSQIVILLLLLVGSKMALAEAWTRWSLFFYIGTLIIYLWGGLHSSETAKASTTRLLAGNISIYFYTGVLVIGIIIPLIITLMIWGTDLIQISGGLLFLRFLGALIGDAVMRYCLMKASLYSPLI
ncbi:DMSO reductase [bacterium]|nr:DMSO reductase [bacterium]